MKAFKQFYKETSSKSRRFNDGDFVQVVAKSSGIGSSAELNLAARFRPYIGRVGVVTGRIPMLELLGTLPSMLPSILWQHPPSASTL